MAKDMDDMMMWSMHKRKKGLWFLIAGLLIMGNAYWNWMNSFMLIGILVALDGLWKLIMPMGMMKMK